jgi:hypothetical protein
LIGIKSVFAAVACRCDDGSFTDLIQRYLIGVHAMLFGKVVEKPPLKLFEFFRIVSKIRVPEIGQVFKFDLELDPLSD